VSSGGENLRDWTKARQRVASSYDKLLRGISDIRTPQVAAGREHVYRLYVIRAEQRDALQKYLTNAGVTTVINYPKALPFYPAYAHLNHTPEDFPNAYSNQSRILSFPIYPEITEEMIG
jgi:dTDP-4-amino-4,6-dideoxygalactose transaminase